MGRRLIIGPSRSHTRQYRPKGLWTNLKPYVSKKGTHVANIATDLIARLHADLGNAVRKGLSSEMHWKVSRYQRRINDLGVRASLHKFLARGFNSRQCLDSQVRFRVRVREKSAYLHPRFLLVAPIYFDDLPLPA
jgi:hypothetical protein